MSRWRNSSQRKNNEVTARGQIKTYISNMPKSEFKTTIIKIAAEIKKKEDNGVPHHRHKN